MNRRLEALFRTYSIIFFTENRWIGLTLLLATFLAPVYGAFGLTGTLIALGAAHWLGFDPKVIRTGAYSFNSLLTSMTLAYLSHFQWDLTWSDGMSLEWIHLLRMLTLVACFSLVAFFITVLLSHFLQYHFGLPSLSLPFVASSALLYFLFYSFTRTPVASVDPDFLLPEVPELAPAVQTFFESFGAIFFLPNVIIGVIIFVCLLVSSRLMVIYGTAAFVAGLGFLTLFGYEITSGNLAWIGFNFLFSGMVLGGIFFIPSRASIPVAMVSAFFCAALAIAFRSLLWNFNIPPLALPFNLVVLTIVYSLNLRTDVSWLYANPFPNGTPELNFWRFHSQRSRFQDALEPSVYPPFQGERIITQGFDGDITHTGNYRHAFDFEIINETGKKYNGPGDSLADFFTYGSDVLSPGDGTVVRIIDHVKDNPVGRNNLAENWGNLVVIQLDSGVSLQISHFKRKGIIVTEGQRVTTGMVLGYCGNSGRSPVPHIHFQLQQSPVVGANTIPFGLCNYIEVDSEGGLQFIHHGRPAQGSKIRSFETSPEISAFFNEFPGKYRYRWDDESEESLTCTIDSIGNYVFASDRGSRLTARIIKDVFHCLELSGNPDSILALFRLALGRIPFSALDQLTWSDNVSVRPFLSHVSRLNLEVTATFKGYAALHTVSGFETVSEQKLIIETRVENSTGEAPDTICLTLLAGKGVTEIATGNRAVKLCD